MKTVQLGEYEHASLTRDFSFKYTPDVSRDVTAQVTHHVMEEGAVCVVVHFQNFGTRPISVKIAEV